MESDVETIFDDLFSYADESDIATPDSLIFRENAYDE